MNKSLMVGRKYQEKNTGLVVIVLGVEMGLFEDKVATNKYVYEMEYFLKNFEPIRKKEQK